MFDLRFSNDPFALPTAMAAAMLAGIVGLGWRMNVAQRLTMPSMTVTAQAAPATPAMTPFRPRIASAAARPAARRIMAHPAAARIAMQMRPVPAAPPALHVATLRPATPPLPAARGATTTALPRVAPVAARRTAAPASARAVDGRPLSAPTPRPPTPAGPWPCSPIRTGRRSLRRPRTGHPTGWLTS